ncbi:MAG: methyltransferase domain-containing protein [Candidatus Margulisbacteria bacterium]|nr:methyltransferase domain-containing protein [Candidatus Margulisiibacteriota bacterium]
MLAKRLISANFSRSAAQYDRHAVMQREMADELFSLLTTFDLQLTTILDIGCGTGYLTKKLAERFPAARVEGIDIAPGMIEEAGKQKRDNLSFKVGDGEEVWGVGEYDLVVSNASLQWMSVEQVFARVRERLKPGGLFLFTTFGPKTLMELKECGFRVNEFPDTIMIEQLLKPHFRNVFLAALMSREKFHSVKELIYYLKELGAAAADGEGQFQLSSFRKYKESYGDEDGISASFELIYGVFEKL